MTPDALSQPSLVRSKRAAAANILLRLLNAGELEDPQRWTWEEIDKLPAWTIEDADCHQRLQLVCGALALSDTIRLMLDRRLIVAVLNLVGESVYERAADEGSVDSNGFKLPQEKARLVVSDDKTAHSAVKSLLLSVGSTVLAATLTDDHVASLFVPALGPGIGTVSHEDALTLLQRAEHYLNEPITYRSVSVETTSATGSVCSDIDGHRQGTAVSATGQENRL